MNWASAADFWNMGGYGLYVWGSYGVCAVLVLYEALSARRGWQRQWERLAHNESMES
jgi:heme exporter protein D